MISQLLKVVMNVLERKSNQKISIVAMYQKQESNKIDGKQFGTVELEKTN